MTAAVAPPLHDTGRVAGASGPVVVELTGDHRLPAPVQAVQEAVAADRGRLPVGRMVGLATSGGFALWTSLTCFVC